MSITEKQIVRQINGETIVEVHFSDAKPDYIAIYDQGGDQTFIKPAFFGPKKIARNMLEDLVAQFTDEQEFNTDPEVIRSGMKYDDFYNRYYNHL